MTISPKGLPTPREFATLDQEEQLTVLCRASARQKLRLLLEIADGPALLARVAPQDLYLLARELGPDQLPELLAMASPEQWTAFFDFDCWEGDVFDAPAARRWVAVLLEGEPAQVAALLQDFDFELLVLMLQREVEVLSGPEELLEEQVLMTGRQREGGYVLDYRDEDGAKLFGALVALLMREAPGFCRYLLEAVRAEGASLLTESVYRQRAWRLLDQGLPAPEEARSVYARLEPENFAAAAEKVPLGGSASGVPPGAILQLARPGGVLAAALDRGLDAELAWELACLANKVIMAEETPLGDLEQLRGAAERTFATLNLALEHLAGDDAAAAARHLQGTYAEQLFRLGFSLTLRLQRRALAIHDSPVGPYLDRSARECLAMLRQRRPLFPVALAEPGRSGGRPFSAVRELDLVETALAALEVRQRLFARHLPFALPAPEAWPLAGCHPRHGRELTLATIFLTALANRLLDRPFVPQPLTSGDLTALHALVSRAGRLDPQLRARTLAWLEELEPGAGGFGAACLDLWEEEFCPVQAATLDPRFVGGLIVRLADG